MSEVIIALLRTECGHEGADFARETPGMVRSAAFRKCALSLLNACRSDRGRANIWGVTQSRAGRFLNPQSNKDHDPHSLCAQRPRVRFRAVVVRMSTFHYFPADNTNLMGAWPIQWTSTSFTRKNTEAKAAHAP